MLDEFESPAVEFAEDGDARMWFEFDEGYRAASPTDSDDPEDEILDDEDLDDEDDDDDLFDDEEDDLDDDDDKAGPAPSSVADDTVESRDSDSDSDN